MVEGESAIMLSDPEITMPEPPKPIVHHDRPGTHIWEERENRHIEDARNFVAEADARYEFP